MKTTLKAFLAIALTACSLTLAQGRGGGQGEMGQHMRERFERKARLMRLLEITEALDLSDQEALKFDQVMARYDQRKQPLLDTLTQGVQVLRRAAQGDATAFAEVDQTVQKLIDARNQIQAVDREMYSELAKQLDPQRKAKLALVLARLPGDMRDLLRGGHGGGGGEFRRGGPNRPDDEQ
jgi:hypothetical protein